MLATFTYRIYLPYEQIPKSESTLALELKFWIVPFLVSDTDIELQENLIRRKKHKWKRHYLKRRGETQL